MAKTRAQTAKQSTMATSPRATSMKHTAAPSPTLSPAPSKVTYTTFTIDLNAWKRGMDFMTKFSRPGAVATQASRDEHRAWFEPKGDLE
jgi:hypothetical protein